MLAKREEQRASLAIRRVMQKVRVAAPQTLADVKKELDQILNDELTNCGGSAPKIKEECDSVVELAEKRIAEFEKKQEEEKAKKEEMEKKKAEAVLKAEGLLKELAELVVEAEAAGKALKEKTEKYTEEKAELSTGQIEKLAKACEKLGEEAETKAKACATFLADKTVEMRAAPIVNTPPVEGEEPKPTLKVLQPKVSVLVPTATNAIRLAATLKDKSLKKAEAKAKIATANKVFIKYDKDKDGHLSKREMIQYAKGEFQFTLAAADADTICKALVKEGGKGAPLEAFHRLKIALGVFRDKKIDEQRKEDRLAKEKELKEMKEALVEKVAEANKSITETEEGIKKLEEAANPLPQKSKTMKSTEMGKAADEVDEIVKTAREAAAEAQKQTTDLSEDVAAELKAFVANETRTLTGKMARFESRIKMCADKATKFRADTSKRDAQELEQFRTAAIKTIRHHQLEKKLSTDGVFEAADGDKDGKVDENDLQKFFSVCEKIPEAKEEETLAKEDLARLFTYLDEDGEGSISKDNFISMIRCYMKVVKETVVTNAMSIKESKTLRRLELGEICEVIEGPLKEGTVEVTRLHVRVLKDGLDGWVTPIGNQGTIFLEEGSMQMKVVKETILTPNFSISDTSSKDKTRKLKDPTRKLKEGELLEVREWMKKEEESGLMRMKVKTKTDGQIGWATSIGNAGQVYLEVA
jgi:Ca2+-binding EF-hand superfamily protein